MQTLFDDPDTDTQATRILAALRQGEHVTPQDALRRFGCFRLAARIMELRGEGWDIRTARKQGDRHATYWMPKK